MRDRVGGVGAGSAAVAGQWRQSSHTQNPDLKTCVAGSTHPQVPHSHRRLDPGSGLCPEDAARVAEDAAALTAMWARIGREVRGRVGGCWVELVADGEVGSRDCRPPG